MTSPQEFARTIFLSDPKPPHTVHLECDTEGDEAALFEVLLLIFTEGLKTMYTPPIHISQVTDESIAKIMHYFASFGIELTLEKKEVPSVLHIKNDLYTRQQRIQDMTFQVAEAGFLYTVRFKFLSRTS
jgi:hypothetical protein